MTIIPVNSFIENFKTHFLLAYEMQPWEITLSLSRLIVQKINSLDKSEFVIKNEIAVHKSAQLEQGVVLKGPAIIGKNCFIGAYAYLRNGVYLSENVTIGPSAEIKNAVICKDSALAHFNFVGDSIIGSRVNLEAGAVVANYYNERADKKVTVFYNGLLVETGCSKFGALIGDDTKIGANAVISPGSLIPAGTIVPRLQLYPTGEGSGLA